MNLEIAPDPNIFVQHCTSIQYVPHQLLQYSLFLLFCFKIFNVNDFYYLENFNIEM